MEPSGKGFRDSNTWGVICSSHSRKTLKRWEQVRPYVEEKGVEFEFVLSDGKDSVERTSKEFCERGCKTLVVIGSDGTLNDVINGVMSVECLPDDFALGMIPSGIGNDFASFWDIPVDSFKHAVDNILARRLKRIDIGVCKYEDENHLSQVRYFLNCVNIGLGARLIQLTNRYQGLIPSKKLSLIPIFIGQIFSRKSFNIAFKADTEKERQNVMSICIGNATGYGQTPNAVPYNGFLDMSVITRPKWWQLFQGFWMLGKGQFLNYKNVHPYRLEKLEFTDVGKASISLDGRFLREKSCVPLRLSVIPDTLNFIINAE